jgi:hypothetical protein
MTESRAITVTGDGPHAGWDFHISRIAHDVDRMEDLYTVALWPPGAAEPTHQFDTYRYGYGWTVLDAALTAADEHADARMQAALDWWTEHHTSTPYQIHRILVAVDETTWATRQEIAHRLKLGSHGLERGTPYGDALHNAEQHGLTTWRSARVGSTIAALTPDGYDIVHPDHQQMGDAGQRRLEAALTAHDPTLPTRRAPAAARAFPRLRSVATTPLPTGTQTPPPTPPATWNPRVAR